MMWETCHSEAIHCGGGKMMLHCDTDQSVYYKNRTYIYIMHVCIYIYMHNRHVSSAKNMQYVVCMLFLCCSMLLKKKIKHCQNLLVFQAIVQ
jgi:hypothetical protein